MTTITLYKWENLQYVPGWWMSKHGFNTEYCGRYGFMDCDEGTEYLIPEGFVYEESNGGTMEFYNAKGEHYLLGIYKGRPVLETGTDRVYFERMPVSA